MPQMTPPPLGYAPVSKLHLILAEVKNQMQLRNGPVNTLWGTIYFAVDCTYFHAPLSSIWPAPFSLPHTQTVNHYRESNNKE